MPHTQQEVNERQKEFYQTFKKNFATRIWFSLRNGILTDFRKEMGVEKKIIDQHVRWLGDIGNKKVLDLGCFMGNSLSIYLAQNSREYTGIDLSETAIGHLKHRIKHIPSAKAYSIDFLSEEFQESNFDIIYAYAVLHHFKDVKGLISKLNEKLASGGQIISYDPTSTSKPIWFIRNLYRPFQSDKDWEWPFTEKTISEFERSFTIIDRRGILGQSKWFFLLNLLPISQKKKYSIGKKWLDEDWVRSQKNRTRFLKCMQVSLFMEKKE